MTAPTPRDIASVVVSRVCGKDRIPNHMVFDTDSYDIGGTRVQCPQFRGDLGDFYHRLEEAVAAWKAKQEGV